MKRFITIITISCFSLLAHGQKVLKVTLEEIEPYDTLRCSSTFENWKRVAYSGNYQASTNSWIFQMPDTLLEQAR